MKQSSKACDFRQLDKRLKELAGTYTDVRHLRLGQITVTIESHVPSLATHIDSQLVFCALGKPEDSLATLRIWQDDVRRYVTDDVAAAGGVILRDGPSGRLLLDIDLTNGALSGYDRQGGSYYLCAADFSQEYIRRMSHLFVRFFFEMAQTGTQGLVHAAAIGVGEKGALVCARGGSGKSTLAVSALLDGFSYVSDDYTVLQKDGGLYAHPLYSTVGLSQEMYGKLKGLHADRLYRHYWQPGKNVYGIGAYKDRVPDRLPVSIGIFPRIVPDGQPSISPVDRGKGVAQLIHSTISQLGNHKDAAYVRMMASFLADVEFYELALSPDLEANTALLRSFLSGR